MMAANEKDFLTQIAEVLSLHSLGTWTQGTVPVLTSELHYRVIIKNSGWPEDIAVF